MIFNIEYRIKRIIKTTCCRRVYYSVLTEPVEADSEQQAIEKIESNPNVEWAKVKG